MSKAGRIIEAVGLSFCYAPFQPVLSEVSFEGQTGTLTCILGPNGAGKTTLLGCLLGEKLPSTGAVKLAGRPIFAFKPIERAALLAYVPQFPKTSFAFSALEIVLMGRFAHTGLLGIIGQRDKDVASEAMKMTHTDHLRSRSLDELSGGEAQRVMIARALAQQPQVMLLDEPTSHLDIRNQIAIYEMMKRVAHDWPMAVVTVSHDVNLAARFADQVVLMKDGQVIAAGSPEQTLTKEKLEETYEVSIELNRDHRDRLMIVAD